MPQKEDMSGEIWMDGQPIFISCSLSGNRKKKTGKWPGMWLGDSDFSFEITNMQIKSGFNILL